MSLSNIQNVALPYCLKMQPCGRYVLLNREYKPVGFYTRDYIDYSNHPILLTIRITPKLAEKISCTGSPNTEEIFLFNDGCRPQSSLNNWIMYAARLQILADIDVKDSAQQTSSIKGTAIRLRNLKQLPKAA